MHHNRKTAILFFILLFVSLFSAACEPASTPTPTNEVVQSTLTLVPTEKAAVVDTPSPTVQITPTLGPILDNGIRCYDLKDGKWDCSTKGRLAIFSGVPSDLVVMIFPLEGEAQLLSYKIDGFKEIVSVAGDYRFMAADGSKKPVYSFDKAVTLELGFSEQDLKVFFPGVTPDPKQPLATPTLKIVPIQLVPAGATKVWTVLETVSPVIRDGYLSAKIEFTKWYGDPPTGWGSGGGN